MRPMAALAIASGYSTPSDGRNYSGRRAVDFGRVASAARCSANASALLLNLMSAARLLPARPERGATRARIKREMRHLDRLSRAARVRRAIRKTAGKLNQRCASFPRDGSSTTRMTPSGRKPDRNPAAQQSPALPRCAILSVGGGDRAHLNSGPTGLPRGDPMKRRKFITLVGGAAGMAARCARAAAGQAADHGNLGRRGALGRRANGLSLLCSNSANSAWIDGRNLAIEYRWAEGRNERYAENAAEFVRLKVDIIVTSGTPATLAAKQETAVIPIVFAAVSTPVGDRPGREFWRDRAATSPGWRTSYLNWVARNSNSCARSYPVFAGWRSWQMWTIPPPCWTCASSRQRPARSALRSLHPKSGERRISYLL